MGLGILFIGYFTLTIAALPLPEISTFIGYILTGYAATKLSAYQSLFKYPRLFSMGGAMLSLPQFTAWLCGLIKVDVTFLAFATGDVYKLLTDLMLLGFHISMYLAVCKLATETNVEKLRLSSARNLVFFCIVYTGRLIFNILAFFGDSFKTAASVGTAVCALAYIAMIIITHVMIFSAYMWICDEKDINMEIKDTGIAWFDKLRHSLADKEQKAADETQKYLQHEYDKKHQHPGGTKKRKKKRK